MSKGFTKEQKARLAAGGWVETTVEELLGLSETESMLIEIRLALGREVAKRRKKNNWTQTQIAKAIGSTQSRVALVERADPQVSADLILKALIATGATHSNTTNQLLRKSTVTTRAHESSGGSAKRPRQGGVVASSRAMGRRGSHSSHGFVRAAKKSSGRLSAARTGAKKARGKS